MNDEFLSEAQIKERFPGEWVLVKQAEFDEQWRVVRGLVAAHSMDRDEVGEAQAALVQEGNSGNMAVLCFRAVPANAVFRFRHGF